MASNNRTSKRDLNTSISLSDACDREAAAAEVGKHHQLQNFDRGVAALGESALLGAIATGTLDLMTRFASHHCSCLALRPVSDATSRDE